MNMAAMAARYMLALVFLVFGLNGFFYFLPMPQMSGPDGAFMTALMATHYFFPFEKGVEVLVGLLLAAGRFVPLALIILAPITINIFLFHAFLAPSGLPMAVAIVLLQGFVAYAHKDAYRELLKAR